MLRKTVPSSGKKYVYQVCANNKNHKVCSSHNISLKKLESIVFDAIHKQIELMIDIEKAIDEIDNLLYKHDKTFSYDRQISKLEEEVEKIKKG